MLTNLKKHRIKFDKKVLTLLEGRLEKECNCYVKEMKLYNDIVKKLFIVDIRNLPDELISYIFTNFHDFQNLVLGPDYYFGSDTYSSNMELIFLFDENRHYYIDKNEYLYDMEFALKRFLTEDQLHEILIKNYKERSKAKYVSLQIENKDLTLTHFNCIIGSNGSGKTVLLNNISRALYVPMFSMNDIALNLDDLISDDASLRKYIYQLTGAYEIGKYSNYEKYINRLAQILEFSREHNNILLLDDLGWNGLDDRSKVNLIDTLFEHSMNNEGVVITGCNESQKHLVKNRVYDPNIIEIKNYE